MDSFISNIELLRERNQWTKEELCDRAKVTPAYYSRLVKGDSDQFSMRIARRLAAVFGQKVVLFDPNAVRE